MLGTRAASMAQRESRAFSRLAGRLTARRQMLERGRPRERVQGTGREPVGR